MRRLRPLDRVLLLTVFPFWIVAFMIHVGNDLQDGLASPPIEVSAPGSPDGYPTVRIATHEPDSGALEPGDRLLRIGGEDLQGVGPIGFFALAQAALRPDGSASVEIERGAERVRMRLEYHRPSRFLVVRSHLLTLGFALSGVLILLRAPRSRSASDFFRAFLFISFFFLLHWGGAAGQTYLWIVTQVGLGLFTAPLILYAARGFPDAKPDNAPRRPLWPLLFAVIAPIQVAANVGFPLLSEGVNEGDIAAALMCVAGFAVLAYMTRNYRRSDLVGRRRIKWVVCGLYISFLPIVAATAYGIASGSWWIAQASMALHIFVPVSVLIAIVRFNLFDIDRILSATAAYTLLLGVLLGLLMTVVPAIAQAASRTVGADPLSAQLAVSVALGLLVVPGQRYLRPRIDRLLFADRNALQDGLLELLQAMPGLRTPRELATKAAERIHELLRPESCVVYSEDAGSFESVFVRGRAVPPAIGSQNPLISVLRARSGPLAAETWSKLNGNSDLSALDRAVLDTLDVALLVPIRRSDRLFAFLCLGPKRSGDIYTSSDLALLAALAESAATQMSHFDDAEIIRQGREMQRELRRYVPGAVAETLEAGEKLEAGERDVSVLFVDIRGYTSFSESRAASEVFSAIGRYTETVSEIVRKHGGSVVEFNGDGMMAVFGAPRELAHKERAAVEAGQEIVAAVGSLAWKAGQVSAERLSASVGIATGEAFVGNVRAVDRMIWSAFGNVVNLASRLEALTRELGASIAIDTATHQGASTAVVGFTQQGVRSIRGLSEAVEVYALPLRGPRPATEAGAGG